MVYATVGASLPTASSIAADVEGRKPLVVDMTTGRATVKRTNAPTSSDLEAAGTSHASGFNQLSVLGDDSKQSKHSIASNISVSSSDDNEAMLANLDNIDKPSYHPSKDLTYK